MSVYVEDFETIFSIKNNIQVLRNKVLELAIQGKLVEQDLNDEPASELLKKIQIERDKLVNEGKIKKQKSLEAISENEIPFEIPYNWLFAKLGDLGDWGAGATPKRGVPEYWNNGTIPWLKTGELNDSYISSSEELITEKAFKESSLRLNKPGDILIAMYGATIGKLGILDIEATTNQACCACTTYKGLYNKYLYYFLMSNKSNFINSGEGGAQPNISKEKIVNVVIPIPPYTEQHLIVTKIECLMLEIDKLEESLKKKEKLMELLPKAVVDAIGSCQTGEEIKVQLQFVIENFETVFQTPDSMQEMRNVVLQLAIEGKLVPQDTADGPASELVKWIQVEKDKLVKEGKIKKQKPLEPIEEDEIPFEIPESWKWVRLGAICKKIGAGSTPTGGKSVYKDNGVKFIRSQNVYNDGLRLSNVAFIDEAINTKMSGSQVESRDILLNITGASIGRCCIVPDNLGDANVNQHVTIIRLVDLEMKEFIQINMISNYIQKLIMDVQVGVSREGLSGIKLSNFIIPLPPAKEQHRIVKKVESMMSLIDQMEVGLKRKADLVEKMAGV